MDNLQRVAIPLGIGAAVIGIWAALRTKNPSVQVSTTAGGVPASTPNLAVPAIAPLEETLIDPSSLTGPGAGTNIGTDPAYNQTAWLNRYSQQPIAGGPTLNLGTGLQGTPKFPSNYNDGWLPSKYISALAPWNNGELAAIVAESGWTPAQNASKSSGKGSGCGGCQGCSGGPKTSNCPGSKNCNGMLDGAGVPFQGLYVPQTAPPAAYPNTVLYSVEQQIVNPAAMGAR